VIRRSRKVEPVDRAQLSLPFLIRDEGGPEVAPAVEHAHDFRDVSRGNPIENDIRPFGNGTDLFGERRVVANPPLPRRPFE